MRLNSATVKVQTPDGTMYLIIMENEHGMPSRVDIQIGKSGTPIRAWSMATSDLINLCLDNGISLHQIVARIIGATSDRSRDNEEGKVSSGPEGVAYAIFSYLRHKKAGAGPYFDMSKLR